MENKTSPGTKNKPDTKTVIVNQNEKPKKRGRPQIHKNAAERSKAWKETKKHEGRRLDLFVSPSVSWRIRKLSKVLGLTMSATVERLLIEACEKYPDQLFEDSERDTILVQKLLEKTNRMEGKA